MMGAVHPRLVHVLLQLARAAAAAVAVMGAVVLLGWALDVPALKSAGVGLATMKPNTAACFVLAGLSLWLQIPEGGDRRRGIARLLAAVAVLTGVLTLGEHVLGWDLGIDRILLPAGSVASDAAAPGRMAPATAFNVVLVAIALFFLDARPSVFPAQYPAMVVALVSFVALLGYAYDVQALYQVGPYASVALHTAAAFLVLSLALMHARPDRGLIRRLTSVGPGGTLLRRLLPAAVLVPFAVGWLGLLGESAGLYRTHFGIALFTTSNIVVFVVLLLWTAHSVEAIDADRRRAEAALRESEQRLMAVLDGTTAVICVKDIQGRYLLTNQRFEDVFHFRPEDVIGRTDHDCFPKDIADAHRANDRTVMESHQPLQVEETAPQDDGLHTYLSVKVPLLDSAGVPFALCVVATDITENKRLAEAERRARELEELNRQAREASRLKSEFLANMSHELRTPLNAIIGFAEMMHDGKLGPVSGDHREFLGDILTSSRHLLQLINDVLDLAKVESGKMEFRQEPVDLDAVAGEVRDILRSLAGSKRIPVELQVAPGLGPVVTDAGKLRQVLYNYLSNALKFSGEGGAVTVRVGPEGEDRFRLEVEDSGIGIEPEDLGRLFVEFQQLDASSSKRYAGTGLGLALTRRIVEAQGGEVGARSAPGRGSTFFAVLPRRPLAGATGPLAPQEAHHAR